jgi:CBS domain containing-hemolysin-like protein
MAVLACLSAFFSGSEAALFSLTRDDRRVFQTGHAAQRAAVRLLTDADRLLSTILFWNLVVNISYFAISSLVSLEIEENLGAGLAGAFALGTFVALVCVGETVPKTLAVHQARRVAVLAAIPLALAARVLDPVMPALRWTNLLTRRLFFPSFTPEREIELRDLERAVEATTQDATVRHHEQQVLSRIVGLGKMRLDELMCPRRQLTIYRPPVALADLSEGVADNTYLLVTEPASDEIAGVIPLWGRFEWPDHALETFAEPVVYLPWCATASTAWDELRRREGSVAVVVNELGETIGIVTVDDLWDTLFHERPSRSERLLNKSPILETAPGRWQVTGMTALSRLSRHFKLSLPKVRSVTVAGVVQELLERLPIPGDQCRFGPFEFQVLEVPERGDLTVELRMSAQPSEEEAR